jgi:glycosyltransferase involved in cell wall biosynthesis
MNQRVVYLQRRSHKAGAQTCLARLARNPHLASYRPIVVCGEQGWLTEELARHGVEFLVEPFPSSRSLAGRLWANRLFTGRVVKKLSRLGDRFVVHGNDHQEAIPTLMIAAQLQAPTALFFRSAGMNRQDYKKYECADIDLALTVSDQLAGRLADWDPIETFRIVNDGIYPEEITDTPRAIEHPPRRFLVLGSPLELKGWRDLIDALCHLHSQGVSLAGLSFDFTGNAPGPENDLGLGRLPDLQFCFLGRRNDFPALLTDYDFAVNPSRHETFGMAAVETVAFGLPLLSSETGVLGEVLDSSLLFKPGDTLELVKKIKSVIGSNPPDVAARKSFQRNVLSRFNINNSAIYLAELYRERFA